MKIGQEIDLNCNFSLKNQSFSIDYHSVICYHDAHSGHGQPLGRGYIVAACAHCAQQHNRVDLRIR